MIFRRRKTRIEIEQTTVTVKSDRSSVVFQSVGVTPPASPAESALARVLPYPAPGTTEANAQPAVTNLHKPAAKETRP
jgi:hypothetical protein